MSDFFLLQMFRGVDGGGFEGRGCLTERLGESEARCFKGGIPRRWNRDNFHYLTKGVEVLERAPCGEPCPLTLEGTQGPTALQHFERCQV